MGEPIGPVMLLCRTDSSIYGSVYLTPFRSLLRVEPNGPYGAIFRSSSVIGCLKKCWSSNNWWLVADQSQRCMSRGEDNNSSSRSINTTQDQQLIGTRSYGDINNVLGENETWRKSVIHFHCVWKEEVSDVSFWHVKDTVLWAFYF